MGVGLIAFPIVLLGCSFGAPEVAAVPAPVGAEVVAPVPDRAEQPVVASAPASPSLVEVRAKLRTTIFQEGTANTPPTPPEGELELVRYAAPLGDNAAYVTPVKPGAKRPAVLWVQGGFNWGIDESAWDLVPRANDQSARQIRSAGIVQMYASLRGWNGNPGQPECLLGEVDDLIAAGKWLAARPDVDPERIYVAGHSTGGTLAVLVAESSSVFRAAVAFGPIADVRHYGVCLPEDAPQDEWFARAPYAHVNRLTTPTWIVEGADGGNDDSIQLLMASVGAAPVTYALVPGRTHFTVLSPGVEQLAAAILADTGTTPALDMSTGSILARN